MTDMTKQTEADRLANQLDYHREYDLGVTHTGIDEQAAAELRRQQAEIERLSEALASEAKEQQAPVAKPRKQEPVAWLIAYEVCCGRKNRGSSLKKFDEVWAKCSFVSEDKDAEINASKWRNRKETALYTSPPTLSLAQRKPMTEQEIVDLCDGRLTTWEQVRIARAIEAAHGIKENT